MRKQSSDEVKHTVQMLIENGGLYNIDMLERLYHKDLKIIKIDETGRVDVIDRKQNMAFFRKKRDGGSKPLSTDAEFNYIDANGQKGHVIVTRKMQLENRPEKLIFSIDLVNEDKRWQVIRETAFVQPL